MCFTLVVISRPGWRNFGNKERHKNPPLCRRPSDDQRQERIHFETKALELIFKRIDKGEFHWVISEVVEEEISYTPDSEKRNKILSLLAKSNEKCIIDKKSVEMAEKLVKGGLRVMDALHLAVAQHHGCDVFLTTDDDLLRRAEALTEHLTICVSNPAKWAWEIMEP